jgi:hypothetical protein
MRCLALLLLASCGAPMAPEPVEPPYFLPFASDFDHFRRWEAFQLPPADNLFDIHLAGPRTVFLARRPKPGSAVWPVGTKIVKAVPMSDRLFAMVKRGGSYNTEGAVGWEWFELTEHADGTVAIRWRGLGPPDGEGYGGGGSTCNVCHVSFAASNDYVQVRDLSLSAF